MQNTVDILQKLTSEVDRNTFFSHLKMTSILSLITFPSSTYRNDMVAAAFENTILPTSLLSSFDHCRMKMLDFPMPSLPC